MVDLVDMAEDFRTLQLQEQLNARPQFHAVSNFECDECGDVIPEQRRKLGGVTLCVTCQSVFETKCRQRGGYR